MLPRRLINVDFADIKAVMRNSGTAMLGVGYGVGPDRALQAAYGEQQLFCTRTDAGVAGACCGGCQQQLRLYCPRHCLLVSTSPELEPVGKMRRCCPSTMHNCVLCAAAHAGATNAPLIQSTIEHATGILYKSLLIDQAGLATPLFFGRVCCMQAPPTRRSFSQPLSGQLASCTTSPAAATSRWLKSMPSARL